MMGEGAEYMEWIEEMHSLDKALHEQGRCEYPCPYCMAEEEDNKKNGTSHLEQVREKADV